MLSELISHLGLSDFLEVTEKSKPSAAFDAGDKHAGFRRGRYAAKPSEWPAGKMWTVPLGALDCVQVSYTQRLPDPPGSGTMPEGADAEQVAAAEPAAPATGEDAAQPVPCRVGGDAGADALPGPSGPLPAGFLAGSEVKDGDCKFM